MGTVSTRLLLACALLLALGAEPSSAQQEAKTGEAAAQDEAPSAIPLRDIPEQIQKDRETLDRIAERAATIATIEPLRQKLIAVADDIDAHQSEDLTQIETVNRSRSLDALTATWAQRRAQLDEIERQLAESGSAMARDLGQLVELRARWKATRDEIVSIAGSDVIASGVKEMVSRIDTARRAVEQRIRPIVEVESRLSAARDRVAKVDQAIVDARRRLRAELFVLDAPPLWATPWEIEGGYRAAILQNMRNERDATLEFGKRQAPRLLVFAALGLAFVASMVLLRRSALTWAEEDPHFASMAKILARPLAGGVLIVLMVGILFVFPDASGLLKTASALVMLWPLHRLLAQGILPGLQVTLYLLGVWFVVDTLRQLFLPESLASRLVLMGEILGAVALIRWMRRPVLLEHLGSAGLMLKAMGYALRLATPLLVVALVANLAGNVSLAELLVQGILFSLYLTYFAHAALGVLKAAFGAVLHTKGAQHSRIVRYHRPLLVERGERFLQLVCTGLWVLVSARVFRVDDLLLDTVSGVLTAPFTVGELELSLADFVLFGFMVWLAIWISRVLRFVLEEDVLARARLPRGVAFAISTMFRYVVLLGGFLVAAAAAGFDIGRFALLAGALGVGIGIGLQNVVNNFVSGLILLFERPIQIGDAVEVGQVSGTVRRIGLRSSTIRMYTGGEVVIPNSDFVSNQFINWTLSDRQRRIELPIGVDYGSNPEQVVELLLGAARSTAKVSPHPAPEVLMVGFGESALQFELRVWTPDIDDWLRVRTALAMAVNTVLREASIGIPFPQRDLHVRSMSEFVRGGVETGGADEPAEDPSERR